MAINKYMQSALKTLTNMDIDVKTNYKLIRQVERIAKKPHIKLKYRSWDFKVENNGYEIPLRVYISKSKKRESVTATPVIIFFHGGGWVTGSLDSYEKICNAITNHTGAMLIAVEYRLAPEYPFPIPLEDCYHTVKAVMKWNESAKNQRAIILMGDSAGGNLAAAVSLYMRDNGEKTADKQILLYPATYNDYTDTSPFPSVMENGTDYLLTAKRICDYIDLYCQKDDDRNNPYFAPLLADDFTNQPDTLIITAQYDPLRDEGEEFGRRLKEAGNHVTICRIADVFHGYFSLPATFAAVKESYKAINEFLFEGETTDG